MPRYPSTRTKSIRSRAVCREVVAPWLRALTKRGAREYLKTRGARVRDVMSRPVVSVRSTVPLHEVARLLDRHRIKRLAVLEGVRLAGVVSRSDLVHLTFSRRIHELPS